MIKGIIFDCFGVLTTDGWLPFKAEHFGHDPELLEQATSLNQQVDSGLLSYYDGVVAVAKLSGMPESTVHAALEANVPNTQLFDYMRGLKADYKLGLLSNAGANWLDKLFGAERTALFDAIALSYETGVIKPSPRAYEIIADRLGLLPEECVLIDDQERFCTGAKENGMQAVWYKNFDQAKAELEAMLANSKN